MYGVHHQPDGSLTEIDHEMVKYLNEGYEPLGWEGDARLFLAWNRADQRMELWRNCEDGMCRMIVRGRPGMRIADMGLIQFLVTHDNRRGYDPAEEIIRNNESVRKALRDAERDKMEEAADRVRHAFQKDIGQTLTGDTMDNMFIPNNPLAKD